MQYTSQKMHYILSSGSLICCPIHEQLKDHRVGVEQGCRTFSIFGAGIVKVRLCLVFWVDGDEAQVLPGYSFGGTGKPRSRPKEYFRLRNLEGEEDTSLANPMPNMPVIRFEKPSERNIPLNKPTTLRQTHIVLISTKTPYSVEGKIRTEDYSTVVKLAILPEDHEFVLFGKLRVMLAEEAKPRGALKED